LADGTNAGLASQRTSSSYGFSSLSCSCFSKTLEVHP
ncbi:hypothetical protein T09_10974, partial [Trichinella sp. T9]